MEIQVYRPHELSAKRVHELAERYEALIAAVGWEPRRAFPTALARSLLVAVAVVDGEIVGAARVVGDGIYAAVLYDLVVHPRMQGRGIGQRLVKALTERLTIPRLEAIADHKAIGFYENTGWTAVTAFALDTKR